MNLLNLHIWSQNDNARKDLSTILCERLQSDVKRWATTKLEGVKSSNKDPVLQEVKQLVGVINEAITSLTPIYSRAQYFNRIGVDYFKVASVALESKVSCSYEQFGAICEILNNFELLMIIVLSFPDYTKM